MTKSPAVNIPIIIIPVAKAPAINNSEIGSIQKAEQSVRPNTNATANELENADKSKYI